MGESAAVPRTDVTGEGWGYRGALRVAEFPRTGWGNRGYDEQAVDSFVQATQAELAASEEQIQDLRLEVDRLHRYIRRQWAAVAAAESAHRGSDHSSVASPAAQARAVLTQAQEIAERRLAEAAQRLTEADRLVAERLALADREVGDRLAEADEMITRKINAADDVAAQRLGHADAIAEDLLADARREALYQQAQSHEDAQRLLAMARTRYEGIIIRAHQRADQAAELALDSFDAAAAAAGDAAGARAELEMKAAYLRTFAKVSRSALQATLHLTGREFGRLLGAADTGPIRLVRMEDDMVDGEIVDDATTPPGGAANGHEPERIAPVVEAQVISLPTTGETADHTQVSQSG